MCLRKARQRAKKYPNGTWNKFLNTPDKCFYCDVRVRTDKSRRFVSNRLTLDHIVPKCNGGLNQVKNIVKCCEQCNNEKDAQDFLKFAISKIIEKDMVCM